MRVPRRNNELNDIVEVLDARFIEAGNDFARAWDLVRPDELAIIDHELERCITDRRYYLENYHCIRTESGHIKTLYPYWTHQEIVWDALVKSLAEKGCARLVVLKPRQAGLTTWTGGITFHSTIFVPHAFSLTMAQDQRVSLEIYNRLLDAYNMLPWWLRPEFASKQQGLHVIFQRLDEKRRVTDPGLGSTLIVSDAQKSTGIAIGRTIRFAHFSEVSRWPDAEVFTADIEPSMNAPDTIAIMESTAYGRNGLFYNMWQGSVEGETGWTPVFIPVYRVRKYFIPLTIGEKLTLTDDEKALRERVKKEENFSIPATFFKWRRTRLRQTIAKTGREDSHLESYPVSPGEAFINSGFCAFPKKCLNEQEQRYVMDPPLVGEITLAGTDQPTPDLHAPTALELKKPKHFSRLWVWEAPDANDAVEYQLAADVASGDGLDYSDACVIRVGVGGEPDTQVAEWHGLVNPSQFARIIVALAIWYHNCEIACEYQGPGITTGNDLLQVYDYPNLYRWRHSDKITQSATPYVHWMTTSKTRPQLFDRMNECLLDHTVVLRCRYLIEEMRDCGRFEGSTRMEGIDNNDDAAFSFMICLFTLRERRRLSGDWGQSHSIPSQLQPKSPQVFGVYNQFMQQVHQAPTEEKAREWVKLQEAKYKVSLTSWRIVPVMVMHANTAWSPIHDGTGAERELYQMGVSPRDITPDVINSYRQSTPSQLSPSSYMDGDD